jgi:glycerol-3-phosphate acyltransferase PlsY
MNMSTTLLIIPISYLLGCFTTGYYLVRLVSGQDIRFLSSGNPGSRNVGRLLGARGFILTFIGDAGKGLLAVYLARRLGGGQLLATAALAAVTAGHIWPLQLRFRGGKGFATFAGGLLLLYPLLLLSGLALCALLYPLLRHTTVTGLAALACTPLLLVIMPLRGGGPLQLPELTLYSLLVLMVLYAHRTNIMNEFRKSDVQE